MPIAAAGKCDLIYVPEGDRLTAYRRDATPAWSVGLAQVWPESTLSLEDCLLIDDLLISDFRNHTIAIDLRDRRLAHVSRTYLGIDGCVASGARIVSAYQEDGSEEWALAAVDLDTFRPAWVRPGLFPKHDVVGLSNGLAIITLDRYLRYMAIDVATGETRWEVYVPDLPGIDPQPRGTSQPLASPDGSFVAFGAGDHVVALDGQTGAARWVTKLKRWTSALGFAPGGRLHSIDARAHHHLDPDTGRITYHRDIGELVESHITGIVGFGALTVADETLYVADCRHGTVLAFDAHTSDVVWSFQCKADVSGNMPPVIQDGWLMVLDTSGNLYTFEEDR